MSAACAASSTPSTLYEVTVSGVSPTDGGRRPSKQHADDIDACHAIPPSCGGHSTSGNCCSLCHRTFEDTPPYEHLFECHAPHARRHVRRRAAEGPYAPYPTVWSREHPSGRITRSRQYVAPHRPPVLGPRSCRPVWSIPDPVPGCAHMCVRRSHPTAPRILAHAYHHHTRLAPRNRWRTPPQHFPWRLPAMASTRNVSVICSASLGLAGLLKRRPPSRGVRHRHGSPPPAATQAPRTIPAYKKPSRHRKAPRRPLPWLRCYAATREHRRIAGCQSSMESR